VYKFDRIGVVIPACNEALGVGPVVRGLRELRDDDGHLLIDDVVVCDNGSDDETAAVAQAAGARVVYEPQRGYGRACSAGINALHPVGIVLFVDADRSVRIEEAKILFTAIAKGADVVIGSRALGKVEAGAMTFSQRAGNDLAAWLIRRLYKHQTTDLGPFRAITWDSLWELQMSSKTYGWTVEMQVKAIQLGMNVAEVPASCNKRIGVSKISGTLKGVIGAGVGILGTIFMLYLRGRLTIHRSGGPSKSASTNRVMRATILRCRDARRHG